MATTKAIERANMLVEKMLTKVKGHGTDIEEAIRLLGERINDFQSEVDLCTQQKFGQTYTNVIRIDGNVLDILKSTAKIQDTLDRYFKGELQSPEQKNQAAFYNAFYKFTASHEAFDAISGTSQFRLLLVLSWLF